MNERERGSNERGKVTVLVLAVIQRGIKKKMSPTNVSPVCLWWMSCVMGGMCAQAWFISKKGFKVTRETESRQLPGGHPTQPDRTSNQNIKSIPQSPQSWQSWIMPWWYAHISTCVRCTNQNNPTCHWCKQSVTRLPASLPVCLDVCHRISPYPLFTNITYQRF